MVVALFLTAPLASCSLIQRGPQPVAVEADLTVEPSSVTSRYRFVSSESWRIASLPSEWTDSLTSVREASLSPRWSDGFAERVAPGSAWSEPHWDFSLPPIEPGATWNDSLEYRTVLGGIQVLYTAIRSGWVGQWEASGADSTLAVTVEARVHWEGCGAHRVSFRAGGSGRSNREFLVGRQGDLRSMVTRETLEGSLVSEGPESDSLLVEVSRIDSVIAVR